MVISMAEKKVTLMLEGLHCGHCAETVANGLKKLKGVRSVEVVYTTSKGKVVYDPDVVKVDEMIKTVKDLGYDVKSFKE
ncbi:MAG: zinc/cadmium/mercury/lead-transporting ATPase [Methanocella sp. PtaU1.Bin125]|nr:MAG: zinc/cadmium/mercury/lead-transporting ATPase [Methanocella sp. PtaU1.Bin125]